MTQIKQMLSGTAKRHSTDISEKTFTSHYLNGDDVSQMAVYCAARSENPNLQDVKLQFFMRHCSLKKWQWRCLYYESETHTRVAHNTSLCLYMSSLSYQFTYLPNTGQHTGLLAMAIRKISDQFTQTSTINPTPAASEFFLGWLPPILPACMSQHTLHWRGQ